MINPGNAEIQINATSSPGLQSCHHTKIDDNQRTWRRCKQIAGKEKPHLVREAERV
jgi:hypothetical protein